MLWVLWVHACPVSYGFNMWLRMLFKIFAYIVDGVHMNTAVIDRRLWMVMLPWQQVLSCGYCFSVHRWSNISVVICSG